MDRRLEKLIRLVGPAQAQRWAHILARGRAARLKHERRQSRTRSAGQR